MDGAGPRGPEPSRPPLQAVAGRPMTGRGPRGPVHGGTSTIVVSPANTFDWDDAAIGAISGMGLALLLVGLALLAIVPRTRSRVSLR